MILNADDGGKKGKAVILLDPGKDFI